MIPKTGNGKYFEGPNFSQQNPKNSPKVNFRDVHGAGTGWINGL